MIIATTSKPTVDDFKKLMNKTDLYLNLKAKNDPTYFLNRSGKKLETDVYEALKESSKQTLFEKKIKLCSGAHFPDIVASKYYGVEVKSTIKDKWTSIGSSVLESTRIPSVERIYLTFGKLANPIEFMSRPYEECLSDIAVTHYPRYRIDMQLGEKETIFDKMNISYEELRQMDEPVKPISDYYKRHLKVGQSLWWVPESEAMSPVITMLESMDNDSRNKYVAMGMVFFPEIFSESTEKFYNYILWLARQGIVSAHIRDFFSAGGRYTTKLCEISSLPAIFKRVENFHSDIKKILLNSTIDSLLSFWPKDTMILGSPIQSWKNLVVNYVKDDERTNVNIFLNTLF